MVADLVTDANAARPITAGGTGATTAIGAADNLFTKSTDIASAATTDLSTATGMYAVITGTTTITAFGTEAAGVTRALRFSGALTLTHNATSLILFSTTNITTYDGLVMIFVSEGSGNWRELSQTTARGTWTPTITFSTPGNLSVTYSARQGVWRKLGKTVTLEWEAVTSAFTHTTASGGVSITGQPFTAASPTGTFQWIGPMAFQGITKASYTQFTSRIAATGTAVLVLADGSGVGDSAVQASDMPTGGAVVLRGSVTFEATT